MSGSSSGSVTGPYSSSARDVWKNHLIELPAPTTGTCDEWDKAATLATVVKGCGALTLNWALPKQN